MGAGWLERCLNGLERLLDVSELLRTSGYFSARTSEHETPEPSLSSNQETIFKAKQCLMPRGFTGLPVTLKQLAWSTMERPRQDPSRNSTHEVG